MDDDFYPPNAFFYPSVMNCIPVDINGIQVNASHDAGAVCHENRHFLDISLWEELKEKNPQLGETVSPHPPCGTIEGTRVQGLRANKMLSHPIRVILTGASKDTKGEDIVDGKGAQIQLRNVLLVQNLPVPLHISAKADRSVANTGVFNSDQGTKFKKECFPGRYWNHPYWTPNGIWYLGTTGSPKAKKLTEIMSLVAEYSEIMEEGDRQAAEDEPLFKKPRLDWKSYNHKDEQN